MFVRRRIGPPSKLGGDRVVSVSISDPGSGIGRGKEGEGESGDGNADKDKEEALFTEHVADRPGNGQPWFWWFWGICIRRRLGFVVSSEYQLRSHFLDSEFDRNRIGFRGVFLLLQRGRWW